MTARRPHRDRGLVTFVGAGPGAADLITLRGLRALTSADIVLWASSLVTEEVLSHAPDGVEVIDSAGLPLESMTAVYRRIADEHLHLVRLHSGDPSLWGALQEQLEVCEALGLHTEVVPGVSAFAAAAAAARQELTVPGVAQSLILTRLGGGKTPMPATERLSAFARHGTTMALYLSAARARQVAEELLAGGYPPDTPVIVGYRVSWPDELLVRCTLAELVAVVRERRLWKHTLFLVGPALGASGTRSHLYHPGHFHGFRRADPAARTELRGRDGGQDTGT